MDFASELVVISLSVAGSFFLDALSLIGRTFKLEKNSIGCLTDRRCALEGAQQPRIAHRQLFKQEVELGEKTRSSMGAGELRIADKLALLAEERDALLMTEREEDGEEADAEGT